MAIFILNKISLLEPKTQNRVRSATYKKYQAYQREDCTRAGVPQLAK
jgi:hypothetical protein